MAPLRCITCITITSLRALVAGFIFLFMVALANAQPPDTVVTRTNPAPAQMRLMWVKYGKPGESLGAGVGSTADINGDHISDFAVYDAAGHEWRLYLGGREPVSREPAFVLKGYEGTLSHPVVGDFWGSGRKALAFAHRVPGVVNGKSVNNARVTIFRLEQNAIDTAHPSAMLDPGKMQPAIEARFSEFTAADLDGDGADELVILADSVIRPGGRSSAAEAWIYKGGQNFQVDSPTVILRDPYHAYFQPGTALMVGRFDPDPFPDLAVGTGLDNGLQEVVFWFGDQDSPWKWTTPARTVVLDAPVALDCDGDGVLDIAVRLSPGRDGIYLSNHGKKFRERSLNAGDADATYYCRSCGPPVRFGYMSDSTRRFEMLEISDTYTMMLFNGSPNGPDHTADAYNLTQYFDRIQPIGDVNDDGWNDVIAGYSGGGGGNGIAIVFAGGSYIPHDSMALRVEDIAAEGRSNALSVWPNPVRDELHIAWRGDLKRMPERFAVYDPLGNEIACGSLESWKGASLWDCAGVPGGTYLLALYDADGRIIATKNIVRH